LEIHFDAIPQIYPKRIKHIKNRLFPFVERERCDFIMEIGHETPKLTIINVSKTLANPCIIIVSFSLYVIFIYYNIFFGIIKNILAIR